MAEKRAASSSDLERALRDLGTEVAFPRPTDLSTRVRYSLERAEPPRAPRRWWRPQLALGLAGLIVAVTTMMVVSPTVREAVADFLGVAGIEIKFGESDVAPAPGQELALGRRVSMEEAERETSFEIRVPNPLVVGEPDAIYLARIPEGGSVSIVYSDESFPRSSETGVGVLLTQFRGDIDPTLVKKVVGPDTTVRAVSIGDGGYWISGAPHTLLYLDADGNVRESAARLAANTLVWEEAGLTYRLESELSLRETLEIARSLQRS